MKIEYTSLENRLKIERKKAKNKYQFHRDSQRVIDFVADNEWLNERDVEVKCEVSTYYYWDKSVTTHISNIPVDEFIENVLGPLHKELGTDWEMKLGGSEDSPTFVFSPTDPNVINARFRINEGEFKVCRFVTRHLGFTQGCAPSPITELQMICE